MLRKQTILDQVEITGSGAIGVRMCKQVVDSDGAVFLSSFHRTAIMPPEDGTLASLGQIARAQMALVNEHLASMDPPYPPVSDEEIAIVVAHAELAGSRK